MVLSLHGFSGEGQDPEAEKSEQGKKPASQQAEEALVFERVQVIGSREVAEKIPGSAHFLSKKELEKQAYGDIHRILRQVPGINIQEEEGYGLRPNIGIRGTGVERSQKITLMEDGVLIAPAPYTAPSAYYFPTAARMESIEVLKGPSTIKQGPYTNGGALNMISSSVPGMLTTRLDGAGGSEGLKRFKGSFGAANERAGWLAETFQLDSQGFKDLDTGGETGVTLRDYLVKFRVNSKAGVGAYQSLEAKLGKTTQFGEETYLGLSENDFRLTPFRRYAASAGDYIDTDHEQYQLRYFYKPNANMDLTTTAYNNDFFRNWHKLERVRGVSNATILSDPDTYRDELRILRGEIDSDPGDLTVRNNRRNYYSRGIQTVFHWAPGDAGRHNLELGARYHKDEEDRFQEDEFFQMVDGLPVLTVRGEPGSQTNRVSGAEALSFFLQDTIAINKWTLRPGVRFEDIDYIREDFSKADPARGAGPTRVRENSVSVWLPGLGTDYRFSASDQVFLGIYKGFSPPGAGANADTREEKSTNYELGYRHGESHFRAEVIGFFNDYENLLGAETVAGGGGGAGELFNGGKVEVRGLEASMSYDFGHGRGHVSLPFTVNYTYTRAEFKSSFETGFADWRPRVEVGDELPYIPENQLTAGMSVIDRNWGLHLTVHYTDRMRTQAGQGRIPLGEGTDSRTVFDFAGDYTLSGKYKIYGQIRNLGDETYLVARRPYGLRPGLPRSFVLGLSARF